MSNPPFVEIAAGSALYRFYGRGEWEVSVVTDSWTTRSTRIHVPSQALQHRSAAQKPLPTPLPPA